MSPTAARNRLASRHFGLVWSVAQKLRGQTHPNIDVDDLVSDGALGLLRAAERFDPSRSVPFQSFALPIIRGAMLDGLRRRNGWRKSVAPVPKFVALDRAMDRAVDDPNLVAIGRSDEVEAILRRLAPRQRLLIRQHFLEGRMQRDVGSRLGISAARTSQLMSRTIQQIRAATAATLRSAAA